MGDDFERAKAIDAVLGHLKGSPVRLSGAEGDLRGCLDAMQSGSLFGDSVVVLDEVEKFSKKQQQILAEQLTGAAGYLVLGARSKLAMAGVVEKEGVVLDLLEEKPWDRERRLADQLIEQARRAGKRLSTEVPALLFERLGVDPALLESEVDKLVCFVGDRPVIGQADVVQISPASRQATTWQTAEEVVWEGKEFPSLDANAFHALVPALRSQLHLGLMLAMLIEERVPADAWNRYLPKLWPKVLEKRSSAAARLGAPFFRKGLDHLFHIELLSRTQSTQYRALLDLFRANLYAR